MKKIIIMLLVGSTIAHADSSYLQVWLSDESTITQRLLAAKALIPSNTTLPEVINLLGKPTIWFRDGPNIYPGPGPKPSEEQGIFYQFRDEGIRIYFSEWLYPGTNVIYLNKIRIWPPINATGSNITVEIE